MLIKIPFNKLFFVTLAIIGATPVFAQAQACTIEYDAAGATVNDSCFPNNGYCNSPGGQFIPGVNLGWCYKTQGNLRGSEVLDRPVSFKRESLPCDRIRCDKGFTCINRSTVGICVEDETVAAQAKPKPTWYRPISWLIKPPTTQQTLKIPTQKIPLPAKPSVYPQYAREYPCDTKPTTKATLDCALPNEESWEYRNGERHTVCGPKKNNTQPRTAGALCALTDENGEGCYLKKTVAETSACNAGFFRRNPNFDISNC